MEDTLRGRLIDCAADMRMFDLNREGAAKQAPDLLEEAASKIDALRTAEMEMAYGRLIVFAGQVARAIATNSAASNEALRNSRAPYHVMWLADVIDNMTSLGRAIAQDDPARIHERAEMLIHDYEGYQTTTPHPELRSPPKETFDAHAEIFALDDGISILRDISARALARAKVSADN